MSSYPAGKLEVRGAEYGITVDDNGRWHADYQGREVWEDTREGLRQELLRLTRTAAARVTVPFAELTVRGKRWVVRRGTATGIHAANGNILIRWDSSGSSEQLPRPYGLLRAMSLEQEAELIRLAEAQTAAQNAFASFKSGLELDLRAAVSAAVEAVVRERARADNS